MKKTLITKNKKPESKYNVLFFMQSRIFLIQKQLYGKKDFFLTFGN